MLPPDPSTLQSRSETIANATDPEALVDIELAHRKSNEARNDPYLICFDEPFDVDK